MDRRHPPHPAVLPSGYPAASAEAGRRTRGRRLPPAGSNARRACYCHWWVPIARSFPTSTRPPRRQSGGRSSSG
eukprot:16436167-Heterocapsa_arctica.AAC.1